MGGLIVSNEGLALGDGLQFIDGLGGDGLTINLTALSWIDTWTANETDVIAIDFSTLQMVVKDSATPANDYNSTPDGKITYTSPSTKWILGSNGLYASGNTIRTEYDASGTALGVRCEELRTNRVLWNRDLTNAAWTKSNVTAAKDQTGIDGAANSASKITASAGNGTCLQSITSASAARITSAFVKRITGSGTIEMTQDNGGTWTAVTVTSSWSRVNVPSATLTNPIVGFRIGTNGDAIAVDFVQEETGAFITSPIATTTASGTRAVDNISFAITSGPAPTTAMTMFGTSLPTFQLQATGRNIFYVSSGAVANQVLLSYRSSSLDDFNLQLTRASSNEVLLAGGSISASVMNKCALGVAANDAAGYVGGASIGTDASCQVPGSMTTWQFGGGISGAQSLNGWLKQVLYVPRRMTNTELGAITV